MSNIEHLNNDLPDLQLGRGSVSRGARGGYLKVMQLVTSADQGLGLVGKVSKRSSGMIYVDDEILA